MSDSVPPLSDEVRRLLELERGAPAAPAELRARAIARATGASRGGGVVVRAPVRPRWLLLAAALGIVALGAFAALRFAGAPPVDESGKSTVLTSPSAAPAPRAPAVSEPTESPPSAPPGVVASSAPAPAVVTRPSAEQAYALELALLQRARAAVASGQAQSALSAIAEHQRRFPSGRLREEREALRVKALTNVGRTDEARRAAERFKSEFPRSVLSSSIEQTANPDR